jgi:hypothetical protein
MPTPGEKRALIFLASVAALGVAVRGWQSHDPAGAPTGDRAGLARQIGLVDSAVSSGGARKRARGGRGRTTDTVAAVPVTAKAPRSAERTGPLVVPQEPPDNRAAYFALREREDSARRRLAARERGEGSPRSRSLGRGREMLRDLPPVDLDVASEEEVAAVPNIGAALARRIVSDRIARGPFGSLDELRRVRGISAALARRLAPAVTFSLAPLTVGRVPTGSAPAGGRRRRGPGAPQP